MNKELEKIIKECPVVLGPEFKHANDLATEIERRANQLNTFCVNYRAEIVRQADLKERRQKAIASTPKPDPNPKTKG
jgi:hypothetical protein